MKQVLVQGGGAVVQQVPAPQVSPKNILVKVSHSCISVGTEMAGIRMSGLPLYRRALKQPEHVKKVLDLMRDQGVKRTWDRVTGKLAAGTPTGYSAAGQIVELGSEVEGFRVGELVACAGAGIANHAEFIDVPVNLAVRVPEGLGSEMASTVTLGAIAMQGVRRASPTLGECFVVVGLGILGQITAQLLRAHGCRVVGVDLDARRIELALQNGMHYGVNPAIENYVERVEKLTAGFGADCVIVTAASESDEIISQAFSATRKKGRVVLVGDVGLDIKRSDIYKKEIDFFISCSYGPGRYDAAYEEGGQDYPLPYVRWTENRNMEEYLRLLADGSISLANLQASPYSIEHATEAFEALKAPGQKPLLVLLSYPHADQPQRRVQMRPAKTVTGKVRIGVAGAGNFATAMHLPNMVKQRSDFDIRAIMTRTGSNAMAVGKQFSAEYVTTQFEQILQDADIDLVLISTRHNLHATMALQALRAGKHVFVEKPLALTEAELDEISAFYRGAGQNAPLLMTGFNRRFAPAVLRAKELLKGRTTPLIVNYRMNAGYIPLDHWVHGAEGGGRNIGEACHIYDLFNALTGAQFLSISAHAVTPASRQWARNDNFVATISYSDGSVCTLTYTALGDKSFPKERMDIFADGKVLSLDDYKKLTVTGKQKGWDSLTVEKGQFQELQALADCLLRGKQWPISLEDQLAATRISFEVEKQVRAE